MSKAVVIKQRPCQVGTESVQVDEECRLPDHLALSMEAQGLCVILSDGVRTEAAVEDEEVHRDNPKAKKAVKDALAAKKKRAAAKPPKVSKPILKKKAAK